MSIRTGGVDGTGLHHYANFAAFSVTGWYFSGSIRMNVEIHIDGRFARTVLADQYRSDLKHHGIGDGAHAFFCPIPSRFLDGKPHVITAFDPESYFRIPGRTTFTAPKSKDEIKDEIYIIAIVKNEAAYIIEWISYHQSVGVDKFIIYDNESTGDTSEILRELHEIGVVDHVMWGNVDGQSTQIAAYANALSRVPATCQWFGVLDADEFLVPSCQESVKDLLRRYQGDAGCVAFNWKLFGSSGASNKARANSK